MEELYIDKVFSDISNELGKSVMKNAKTREDKIKGLELLINFKRIMDNYESVIEILRQNEKKEKEDENR